MIRPSEIVRSIEDGVLGTAILVRGVVHGLKRDVLIEYTARQLAREAKRERRMSDAERMERTADMALIIKRADELMGD